MYPNSFYRDLRITSRSHVKHVELKKFKCTKLVTPLLLIPAANSDALQKWQLWWRNINATKREQYDQLNVGRAREGGEEGAPGRYKAL